MQIFEPRQVRKEAAVRRHLHVPLSSWILLSAAGSFMLCSAGVPPAKSSAGLQTGLSVRGILPRLKYRETNRN